MRTEFTILLLLCALTVSAQVVRLPDVDVTGIETTRSFIYKSNILPDIQTFPLDSLYLTLPRVNYLPDALLSRPTADHRYIFLDLGISSLFQTDLGLSILMDSLQTTGMQFRMQQLLPAEYWYYQRYNLFIDPALNTPLYGELDYRSAQYDDSGAGLIAGDVFENNLMSINLHSRHRRFKIHNLSLANIHNLVSFQWLQTDKADIRRDRLYANLDTSLDALFKRSEFHGRFAMSYWQPAFQAGIKLNPFINLGQAEESAIGFMADNIRFVPYLAFRYEYAPTLNSRIVLINQPEMSPLNMNSLYERLRWFDLGNDYRHAKNPLNLRFVFSRVDLNLGGIDLEYLNIEMNATYSIDATYTGVSQNLDPIPTITYGNIAANTTQINLAGMIGETHIQQSLGNRYSYLYRRKFSRTPYQPLYFAQTRISRTFGETKGILTIDQQYNRIDHAERALPEYANVSVAFERDLTPDLSLSAALTNILSSHLYPYRNLPRSGASAEVRLRFIF